MHMSMAIIIYYKVITKILGADELLWNFLNTHATYNT